MGKVTPKVGEKGQIWGFEVVGFWGCGVLGSGGPKMGEKPPIFGVRGRKVTHKWGRRCGCGVGVGDGFGVGVGFGVGDGFRVGFGVRIWGLGFGVWGLGMVLGFRIWGGGPSPLPVAAYRVGVWVWV